MNDDKDYYTIEAMGQFGGSFVSALANAARFADPNNLRKIKETWSEYWAEYEKMGQELKAKRQKQDVTP